tara:strand:+ start:248 stop:460 length:213 start_codon:yes stop_codon:yes gene_type:complete
LNNFDRLLINFDRLLISFAGARRSGRVLEMSDLFSDTLLQVEGKLPSTEPVARDVYPAAFGSGFDLGTSF